MYLLLIAQRDTFIRRSSLNMLGRFNKVFGIHDDLPREQKRFVERINQTAFGRIQDLKYPLSYESIFKKVCYWLGTNAEDRIPQANRMNFSSTRLIPDLRSLTS